MEASLAASLTVSLAESQSGVAGENSILWCKARNWLSNSRAELWVTTRRKADGVPILSSKQLPPFLPLTINLWFGSWLSAHHRMTSSDEALSLSLESETFDVLEAEVIVIMSTFKLASGRRKSPDKRIVKIREISDTAAKTILRFTTLDKNEWRVTGFLW